MTTDPRQVDVLIVGAGPVGLITAFQLAKFGGISVAIIEKNPKSIQDAYGRAITLYPRSSEMLDQLGLAEELAQQCFACRETATYNSHGEEVHGRGWSFMETGMSDTAWNFALVLRQKYQEDVFRRALREYGVEVEAPVRLDGIVVDESIPLLQHRVTATVHDELTSERKTIKCKFVIGCDGGHSSVRRLMDIPFHGLTTADKWVRVDGLVETNVPRPRTYCAIESPTHGNVLWVGLDRGRTRIGYAFTQDREKAYEVFDEAAAVKEAIAAVKPFDVTFLTVDWWTIYSVGQRIAETFEKKDCIFLAGDACHTHSSGAAQGMNTGIHDSVNLAWKLSLVLRRLARTDILQTYQAERMPNVQRLIQYDRDISRLMTNRLPEDWQGDPEADVNAILGQVMGEAGSFSSGLGIFYELAETSLLSIPGSFTSSKQVVDVQQPVGPGRRAPDVTLLKPGTFESTRLISETPNRSSFYLLLFAGNPLATKATAFADAVDTSTYLSGIQSRGKWASSHAKSVLANNWTGLLECLTVLPQPASSAYEVLGREPLGRAFFDTHEGVAYKRYGVDVGAGCVVLVRPDGWIGTMLSLSESSVREVEMYFSRILL